MTWTVCGECTQLKGTVDRPNRSLALGLDGMYQACACEERDESTWRGYDFNLDRELCRVCALAVVPSGSKWSRWLCSTCVRLARETNDRWGVCIIPVGRHSLVNGVGLRGGGEIVPAIVEDFVRELGHLFERMDHLEAWRTEAVERNRAAAGLPADGDVPLARYLTACAAAGITADERFAGCLQWFRVPSP